MKNDLRQVMVTENKIDQLDADGFKTHPEQWRGYFHAFMQRAGSPSAIIEDQSGEVHVVDFDQGVSVKFLDR